MMPGFDLVRPLPHRPAPSFNSLGKANSTRGEPGQAQKSGFLGSSTISCSILSNCVNHLVSIEQADLDHLRQ